MGKQGRKARHFLLLPYSNTVQDCCRKVAKYPRQARGFQMGQFHWRRAKEPVSWPILLKIDKSKIAAEEKLDGKFLIKTSDDTLSLSDMVLGYKQLHDIERGFRTLKSELELRPVYHRKSDRIRAHVLLCWLALLLIRIVENETGMTWFQVRKMLKQINLISLQLPEGIVHQSTTLSKEQSHVYHSCKVKAPPKIIQLQPA